MIIDVPAPNSGDSVDDSEENNLFSTRWYRFIFQLWKRTGASLDKVERSSPIGGVQSFAGSTIPPGWLECDGTAVSRSTFAELFGVIGVTYGVGDGSTTFDLPDLTGVVLVAAGPLSLDWMIKT